MKLRHAKAAGIRQQRSGYILLTTLLIIAMVGILTVGLARHSVRLATDAKISRTKLQEKWGAASCQRCALARSSALLNRKVWDPESETWKNESVRKSENTIVLGEVQFQIQVDDESAKLNLNRMLEAVGRQKTASLARQLAGSRQMKVELRTLRNGRNPMENSLESWAQVFQLNEMGRSEFQLPRVTSDLTCWGSQLNYQTASEEVVTETVKPLIGGALTQKLIRVLQSDQADDWQTELQGHGGKQEQIQALEQVLTSHSQTQAIWVRSESKRREHLWLTVREQVASSIYRVHSFRW